MSVDNRKKSIIVQLPIRYFRRAFLNLHMIARTLQIPINKNKPNVDPSIK
jgi:hypothetical protein